MARQFWRDFGGGQADQTVDLLSFGWSLQPSVGLGEGEPFEVHLGQETVCIHLDPQIYTPSGLVPVGLRQVGIEMAERVVGPAPPELCLVARPGTIAVLILCEECRITLQRSPSESRANSRLDDTGPH